MDSPAEKQSEVGGPGRQEAAKSPAALDTRTPVSQSLRISQGLPPAGAEGMAVCSKDSPAGQEATPEGLLASSDKPGSKDGKLNQQPVILPPFWLKKQASCCAHQEHCFVSQCLHAWIYSITYTPAS